MKPCAQQATLDCAFGTSWNGNFASMFEPLFNCVKDKGKTCKAPIWQHFLETVVAFEEEFKKHHQSVLEDSGVRQNPEDRHRGNILCAKHDLE